MTRLVDWLAQELVSRGITHLFGVTGGAAVHIFDAFSALLPKDNIRFFHHEQHAGYAAESYSRLSGKPALLVVTSGPGGTNAITPVVSAWIDSVPLLVLSGQSRSDQLKLDRQTRQMGSQEVSIGSLVSECTAWFGQLTSPENYDRIVSDWLGAISKETRSGPSWLDLPLDVQLFNSQSPLRASEKKKVMPLADTSDYSKLADRISSSQRPILAIGAGARFGGLSAQEIQDLVSVLNIPTVATWNALDSIDPFRSTFLGVFGVMGQRSANLALHEADLVIGIGTHFGGQITGPRRDLFATGAEIVTLNPDEVETLARFPNATNVPWPARDWPKFIGWAAGFVRENSEWRDRCRKLISLRYEREESNNKDIYSLLDLFFSKNLGDSAIVVDGGGTVTQIAFHCFTYQSNLRCFTASGLGAMGSGLPEAIGASEVSHFSQVFCLVGDGSFMTNLSALANVTESKIPVKILVMENDGYASIRNTQKTFLENRLLGSTRNGGLPKISIVNSVKSFGLKCSVLNASSRSSLAARKMNKFVNSRESQVMVASLDFEQNIIPRTRFVLNEDGTRRAAPIFDMEPPRV